jgi:hypothetical protein
MSSEYLRLRFLETSGIYVFTVGKGLRERMVELSRGSTYFERRFDAVQVARAKGLDVARDGTVVEGRLVENGRRRYHKGRAKRK